MCLAVFVPVRPASALARPLLPVAGMQSMIAEYRLIIPTEVTRWYVIALPERFIAPDG